jgi:sialidase-1
MKSIYIPLGWLKYLACANFLLMSMLAFSQENIVRITIKLYQTPVLRDLEYNPIVSLKIESNKSQKLTDLKFDLSGTTDLSDLKSLDIFWSGQDSIFFIQDWILKETDIKEQLEISLNRELNVGVNYIWISCSLQDEADLLHRLSIQLSDISFKSNAHVELVQDLHSSPFRFGVALRQHGQDDINTYRIPGLATTDKGTLMAVYDARRDTGRDLQGDIDIGLNRSFDQGTTWESMQIIMDMGEWGDLPQKFNGVSDASILLNGKDIFVAGLWMHGVLDQNGNWVEGLTVDSTNWNHQWRDKGSQPGFGEKQTAQFLIVKSADDGYSWSKPVNLTKMCKKEDWWLWAPAPGRGIVMTDGTLVFPSQGRDQNGLPFSNITFSVDNGITWQTSNPASHNTTECAVAEYEPGKLMLNIRDNRNRSDKSATNGRAIFTSSDKGNNWIEHETSHRALVEPVCMGSLHKHVYWVDGKKKEVLLFSNPNSKYQRDKLTIKMSFDGGQSWPGEYWILLDEGQSRGYSCLTSIDDTTIGIVYEGSRADLVFQKIDLSSFLSTKK